VRGDGAHGDEGKKKMAGRKEISRDGPSAGLGPKAILFFFSFIFFLPEFLTISNLSF
jgi:hypothetical protein